MQKVIDINFIIKNIKNWKICLKIKNVINNNNIILYLFKIINHKFFYKFIKIYLFLFFTEIKDD